MSNFLNSVIDAHGGLENWSKIKALQIELRLGGNLLLSRMHSPFLKDYFCTIFPGKLEVIITPFPKPGFTGIYSGNKVRVEAESGHFEEREISRKSLIRNIRWDSLDLLYFYGYLVRNYSLTPFLFLQSGFEIEELAPIQLDNLGWVRGLKVRFPESIPTHCREQSFYFNESGLLVRLEYTAEIFGKWARGIHLCSDHHRFGNIVFPTKRIVYADILAPFLQPILPAMQGYIKNVTSIHNIEK